MIGLFVVIGFLLGGYFGDPIIGMIFFLVIAGIFNAISYFYSSKIVLWSYKAKIVTEREAPRLYKTVHRVALKSDLPMPKIAIIPTMTPNAFATGRNPKNAVVAATEGLLQLLNDDELEGVIAHEMAHVKDRDILVMSVAATLAGAIAFAARFVIFGMIFGRRSNVNPLLLIAVAVLAPIAAILIQLAISRAREFKADKVGAIMIQKPWALANALEKLERGNRRMPLRDGNPASASLFIVNPFRGSAFFKLFSTHPPIEERVRRLREMQF